MPFQPGNTLSKGRGRPRTLATELRRLQTAAAHINRLLEQLRLAELLSADAELEPELQGLLTAGLFAKAQVEKIDRAAGAIEAITKAWPLEELRRRPLGRDPRDAAVQTAAISLDRAAPPNTRN